jgi:hypothetical protein
MAQPYVQSDEAHDGSWALKNAYTVPLQHALQPLMMPVLSIPGLLPTGPQMEFQQDDLGHVPRPAFTSVAAPQQQQQARHFSKSSLIDRNDRQQDRKRLSTPQRAPVVTPSAESGGVPNPTPAYILRASSLPRTLPSPRHMLVIIDLNGTLLYRPSRKSPGQSIARPHARDFLSYCASTFHVMIWSSARLGNVRRLVDSLLTPQQQERIVAVWGRESFGLSRADFGQRVMCYKRLGKVWADEEIARQHPYYQEGERWDQGNTVLVDDTLEKARSEPHNAVQLPEFAGDVYEAPAVLPQVHDYLNELAYQADISSYIHASPFLARRVSAAPALASSHGQLQ